jgi:hypothetical protein
MADAPATVTATNSVSTTPSGVKTITIVAQVVGTLVTAYGSVLSAWAAQHGGDLWPGVVTAIAGLLVVLATHFGYVKGEATTQNAIVNALVLAASSPLAVQLIQGLITKTPAAGSSTATPASPTTGVLPATAAAASSALQAANSNPAATSSTPR